jgi:hypothetical protein
MTPRGADGAEIPVADDLGKAFLYARYDADLSRAGLDALGFRHVEPARVQTLDAVGSIPQLREIGRAVAREVDLERQFAPFFD